MNWGKGLVLVMIAFAGMLAYFMVLAVQSPEPLIAENYYEQELVYQDRIDATQRAEALSAAPVITADRNKVVISFPAELEGAAITGVLQMIRLNDVDADRKVVLVGKAAATMEAEVDLQRGSYIAQLTWEIDGREYFHEDRVIVP